MRKVLALAACLLGAAALTACTTVDATTGETVKSNTKTGALTGARGKQSSIANWKRPQKK